MIEHITIAGLGIALIGTSYKWFMAHLDADVHRYTAELLHEDLAILRPRMAELIAANFKLMATERRRTAQRKAAGDKGRATQIARAAAARHARMDVADQRLAMKVAAE